MLFESLEAGKAKLLEFSGYAGTKLFKEGLALSIDDELPDAIAEELFTKYYDGCGGVSQLELEQVPFGQKFVPFDLD